MQVKSIQKFFIYLFFFTGPFVVSSIYQNVSVIPTSLLVSILLIITSSIVIFKKGHLKIDSLSKSVIVLFFLPIFLSTITIILNIFFIEDLDYKSFLETDFVNRLINVLVYFFVTFLLVDYINNENKNKIFKMISLYLFGCIFMLAFGVWQLLHFVFGIPFLELDTRSLLHSVDVSIAQFNFRLTSLANEPSFFAPFIIDSIILSFLFIKKSLYRILFILFATMVLFFTFSGGGYVNLLLVVVSLLVILNIGIYNKFKYKTVLLASFLTILFSILGVFIFNIFNVGKILYPVLGRFDTMFDSTGSARTYMVTQPFKWIFEYKVWNILFGLGPNSFEYLKYVKKLPSGEPIHSTSNNLFTDFTFENGFVGLICVISIFIIIMRRVLINLKIEVNKYSVVTYMLLVHLFITSMYRADYLSPRFWIIILIIIYLVKNFKELKYFEDK
ncbi:O-antigen ligase family protein [Psychrobacillus soli]|uniref:O-antigen ligase-related domain-containing protein n=1 Tax=Psychrobacillus soli TaxID=1543965 RepID=A0A544T5Q2_9BACI|nr:O-antigen ligase family protein [Psychrobacillus soli]TQR12718.1 hypothetical protein FG383_13300 [Psychrobacillus soli]